MERKKQHVIDIVFVLCLFCVFAILSLFVVVMGANVYQGISADMTENYNVRSSVTYLTEKIRQNDIQGGVSLREFDGKNALVLTDNLEGQKYETWIYAKDGALYEILITAGTEIAPGDGQMITEIADLQMESLGDSLLKVTAVDLDGNMFGSMIHTKSAVIGK